MYSSEHISVLQQFGRLVGRDFGCAVVYNDASPDWAGWEMPWFIRPTYPDTSWNRWIASRPGRQLVITQNLFPSFENGSDWLHRGASGLFTGHARALARNLIRAGLGGSIIRLAHEANGTWYPDSIPGDAHGDALWVRFWRRTVLAMRSVPGARFRFDWTVNAAYRAVPLRSFYPGNDVVDIIGIDAYDSGVAAHKARWPTIVGRPDGIAAVADFARSHQKSLSLPEWGIGPSQEPGSGLGGDDPAYINGIAQVVKHDNVAYQAYWDAGAEGTQFFNSPRSIAMYRRHFGSGGDALPSRLRRPHAIPASAVSPVRIVQGPRDASVVHARAVTFAFKVPANLVAQCSLDSQPWRPCSRTGADAVAGLRRGYHFWDVKATGADGTLSLAGRAFVLG